MQRRPFLVLASFFAILIFAGLNIAAQSWLSTARLDFTENRLYTLSDGTREVAASLAEPVDLTFVFSRRLAAEYPAMRTYGARVRELLAEIAAKSGGDVRVREVDPSPFSAEEDEAIAAGLSSAPTSDGDPLYLGVIGRNSVDDEIIIPFLGPERETLLEYDLARLIAQLDDPQPPRVGVLSSLPGLQGRGMEADAYYVLREMARSFEIVPIADDF
ncbi:MAG: GldG family protein, partial [Pseudomonadota bacterium]